jgi:hypothetical protein
MTIVNKAFVKPAFVVLVLLLAVNAFSQKTVQERLGYPKNSRLLIIHADDLGMSHSVNRATFDALEHGYVTSASILVPCPWFPEVARWAKLHPEADLGIHMALNSEWNDFRWRSVAPQDKVPSLLDEHGYLPLLEEMVRAKAQPNEVEIELRAQIDQASKAGLRLSHLDSHMTTLLGSPPLYGSYNKIGREYGLPLLLSRGAGTYLPAGTSPAPYALVDKVVAIDVGVAPKDWFKAYQDLLHPLPPGVYQLIVHTAFDDEEMRGATWDHPNWGSVWRQFDYDMLKSSEFRQFLKDEKFILVSWRDLAKALPSDYKQAQPTVASSTH